MQHVLIVVHGTWGKSKKGFYQESKDKTSFCQQIQNALGPEITRENLKWLPFEWEHDGNNHQDRLDAANKLAETLLEYRKLGYSIHLIAHSHGGNVVLKGMEIYLRKIRKKLYSELEGGDMFEKSDHAIRQFESLTTDESSESDNQIRSAIDELQEALTFERERSAQPKSSLRSRFLLKGTYEYVLSRLLDQITIRKENHQVLNIVTLGTPFYFKEWQISKVSRIVSRIFTQLMFWGYAAFFYYVIILFVSWLLALFPGISFLGLNPFDWNTPMQYVFSLLVISTVGIVVRERKKVDRNTNVYFDAAVIGPLVDGLKKSNITRILNVHAGFLDEPYLVLSALPILKPVIHDQVENFTKPNFWTYKPPRRRAGIAKNAISARLMRLIWSGFKRLMSVLLAVLYPLRYLYHIVAGWFLRGAATKRTQVTSLGLNPVEFAESEITINFRLKQDFFECEAFDASEHLKDIKINTNKELERFDFLWNNDLVEKKYSGSAISKFVKKDLDLNDKKRVLALEERGREYFGVSGVRHSMYYENEHVISKVASFIKAGMNQV